MLLKKNEGVLAPRNKNCQGKVEYEICAKVKKKVSIAVNAARKSRFFARKRRKEDSGAENQEKNDDYSTDII